MTITFTLNSAYTGATYVAGPFNISGTTTGGTTYELATGVTKNQLITGYTINTAYETLSGGTITSTGTCSTEQLWTTGIGGGSQYTTLDVYAKDIAVSRQNQSLFYYVNGNAGSTTYIVSNAQLPSTCQLIASITGLTNGDTVTFSTDGTVPMNGTNGGGNCPGSVGSSFDFTASIDVTGGTDYCSLTIESGYAI